MLAQNIRYGLKEYIEIEENSFVKQQSKQAFSTIKNYYEGSSDADDILSNIETAIMIQRMVSKSKEIYDNILFLLLKPLIDLWS